MVGLIMLSFFIFIILMFFGTVYLFQNSYVLERGVILKEEEKDPAQEWLNYNYGLLKIIISDISNFYDVVVNNKNKLSKSDLNICSMLVVLQISNITKMTRTISKLSIRKLRKYLDRYRFNGTTLKVFPTQSIIEAWAIQDIAYSIKNNINTNKVVPTVCDKETMEKCIEKAVSRLEGVLNGTWGLS